MALSPLRVLCLDIEGGHGGSSRSLFHVLRHMDRSQIQLEVWCKRKGAIQTWYSDIEIPCRVEPDMPKVSALPRFSRNLYAQAKYRLDFLRSGSFRAKLVAAASHFDVIHANHEALSHLMFWLRPRIKAAIVIHNRTMLHKSLFACRQIAQMNHAADRLVFITENERDNVRKRGGSTEGIVIYNVVAPPTPFPAHDPQVSVDFRLNVASLSNYSYLRGTDRLVDIALALQKQSQHNIRFVVAGDMKLSRSLPGELGRIGAGGRTLVDYVLAKGVGDYFQFLGYVQEPERVLACCHVLIKPTRENNPWGRDILEAMAMGLPTLSFGTYDRFIKHNQTGYLLPEFNPIETARLLSLLASNRPLREEMGRQAQKHVALLCNGSDRAEDLKNIWYDSVLSRHPIESA